MSAASTLRHLLARRVLAPVRPCTHEARTHVCAECTARSFQTQGRDAREAAWWVVSGRGCVGRRSPSEEEGHPVALESEGQGNRAADAPCTHWCWRWQAADLEKDLSARRVVRQESIVSLKAPHKLERRGILQAHSTSSLKGTLGTRSSGSSLKGTDNLKNTHNLERRASVARLESAGYSSSSEPIAPKPACRLVMSRCIDGVPLDELACQMAEMAEMAEMARMPTDCDTRPHHATPSDVPRRDSKFVSEVELEWQDVLRCEADLDKAAAEYYESGICGDYESGICSPDMTPKNTPVHSPDFSFRMALDHGNARGLTTGGVSGGADTCARPLSTTLSRGQVDMIALPSCTDACFALSPGRSPSPCSEERGLGVWWRG